jgi:hypothetical protein
VDLRVYDVERKDREENLGRQNIFKKRLVDRGHLRHESSHRGGISKRGSDRKQNICFFRTRSPGEVLAIPPKQEAVPLLGFLASRLID